MNNSILISIILMVSIVMTSCTNQPPPLMTPEPIPTPPPTVMVVDDKAMVMESLIEFNDLSNKIIDFLQASQNINNLKGNSYHSTYITSTVIISGLDIYKSGMNNWNPPDNSYQDELIEIKKAELYRINHFIGLTEFLMSALLSQDKELIAEANNNFNEWRTHSDNIRPANLQNDILEALKINADSVNFLWILPREEPTLPPQFQKPKGRTKWKNN